MLRFHLLIVIFHGTGGLRPLQNLEHLRIPAGHPPVPRRRNDRGPGHFAIIIYG